MGISCDCSNDNGNHAEFYIEEFPKSNKEHKCCECGETIKKGYKYHKVRGMWEGDFRTYKTCITCYNIRNHYCRYGFVFTQLAEQISECLGFDYREKVE